MRKGNKGEWSELYTFLKLLSDGKLYAADANLDKMQDIYYPLIKILRWEKGRELEYLYSDQAIILEDEANSRSVNMPIGEFKDTSLLLLERIKEAKGSSFSVREIEEFLNSIKYETLKAGSSDKSDIYIKVHDHNTGMEPVLGFSIKSRLGKASTLLNPGKTTNFIYKITGKFTEEDMEEINRCNPPRAKIRDRMASIEEKGCTFEFVKVSHEMFNLNLQVIDSRMPEILANLLKYYYGGQGSKMDSLLQLVKNDNPCKFNSSFGHDFYEYKVKSFMRDVALGMTPSKMWNGHFDATGGYIVVKEDGEIVCYHIYNHNEFQEYLLKNTKLDSPSSSRYDYGKVYEDNGEYFFNLNLQIRFV